MITYNMKHYYIIFAILNASEINPVSSKELSKQLSLSDKTIQNNITLLNEYCRQHGFEIISKSGNGFYPLINDELKASRLKQNLAIYFSKNYLTQSSNSLQIAIFILYILSKDTPISINDLCDKFYFSKSTIYTYLAKATHNLDYSGNITVVNDAKGIYTIADEFYKRYYIASSLANDTFLYDLDMIFGYDFHFLKPESRQTLKVIQLLQKYNFSLNDERFERFLIYLTYSHYRYLHKYSLNPKPFNHIDQFHGLLELDLARDLTNTLGLSFSKDPVEITTLAALLLVFNDKPSPINAIRYGTVFFRDIETLYASIDTYIKQLSPEFRTIPNYQNNLIQLIYHVYFLHKFDLFSCNFNNFELNLIQTPNALIRYMARLLTRSFSNYYGIRMGHRNASYVCLFCQNMLYSLQMERSDLQILLILKEGNLFSEYIVKWLYNHLQPKPYAIKQMSLYEANIADLHQYDLILTDYNQLDTIQSQYSLYKINTPIDSHCEYVNEYYRICNQRNINIDQLLRLFSHIEIHDHCSIVNTEGFLTQLDTDLDGLGNIPIREIRKLGRPINYYADHKILIVPYLYKNHDEHENIMAIYFNHERLKMKYSVMVFFSLYCDFTLSSLLKIMNISNEFCVNPTLFYEIQRQLSKSK